MLRVISRVSARVARSTSLNSLAFFSPGFGSLGAPSVSPVPPAWGGRWGILDSETALGSSFVDSSPSADAAENQLSAAAAKAARTAYRVFILSSSMRSKHPARLTTERLPATLGTYCSDSTPVAMRNRETML